MNVWAWTLVAVLAYLVTGLTMVLRRLFKDSEGYAKVIHETFESDSRIATVIYSTLIAYTLSLLWPVLVYDWIKAKVEKP